MEFKAQILKKLSSLPQSLDILHHVIDNWILFQRKSFEHYDDTGDPYISQIFLIEISTGRYIHRSQGQKVDQGTSLDLDVLASKLAHVFNDTKPCRGFPLQNDMDTSEFLMVLNYPYQRQASKECQFYFDVSSVKNESDHDDTFHFLGLCGPCQETWQDIDPVIMKIEDYPSLGINASEDLMSSQSSFKIDEEDSSNPTLVNFDYEVLNANEEDLWSSTDRNTKSVVDSGIIGEDETSSTQKPNYEVTSMDEEASKGRRYTCKCCSLHFDTPAELLRHRRVQKLKRRAQRKVGCLDCDNSDIVTFKQLADHVAKEHPDKLEEYEVYQPKDQDPSVMKEPLKCIICDFMNNGGVSNFRHRELYHDLGSHVCNECQEPNLTYYDLMIHNYQKHHKPTEYLRPSLFGLDIITQADGKIQFKKMSKSQCSLCSKVYKKDYGLITHMRCQHSWGMFNCSPCGESCHYSKDLSAHVLQFHGENPVIKCPNCLQDFTLKENYDVFNTHYETCLLHIQSERKHKSPIGQVTKHQDPFQCDICGKSYSVKRNLDLHMDAHQGILRFKCAYCEFGTNHKHVIEDHEGSHLAKRALTDGTSRDLLHQCEQCGKQLRSAKLLKRHVRVVHEGKKPSFQCKDCGEFFKHFVALYKHKKYSHGFVSKSKHI
ncbi:zinc finger protein 256-like [Tigriopus californicus]|uniref:zinc finger protein 256-like n=1 Tax=Tigriopus californicus TaxID=6832 RepID=UPI0027DAA849|nr:zinc finger protein 256-like [Tigriopus californicus]